MPAAARQVFRFGFRHAEPAEAAEEGSATEGDSLGYNFQLASTHARDVLTDWALGML